MPTPRKPRKPCAHCGEPCARPTYSYCSNRCQLHYQQAQKIAAGQASPVAWRNYLLRSEPHRGTVCRSETWNGQPIPLELDHIDGNPERNTRANLRLLCPNGHAPTAIFLSQWRDSNPRCGYPS